MTVTIRPEDERLIEDAWLAENRGEIGEKIERALAQFERGEFFTPEESRAEMDRRKAEWLREHRA